MPFLMTDPRVKSSIAKLSTLELFDLFGEEGRRDRLKGWTSWQTSGMPDGRIMASWGHDRRQLHNGEAQQHPNETNSSARALVAHEAPTGRLQATQARSCRA
jgi:hypothetical protein